MHSLFIKGISARTSNYYWGHFKDYNDSTNASVILITTEPQPVSYFIEVMRSHLNGTLPANRVTIIYLPGNVVVSSHAEQHKGIHIGIQSERVTLIGQTMGSLSSDTFLILPTTNTYADITCPSEYIYYGISAARAASLSLTNMVLIVGTEDNTKMKLTVPQSVHVSVGNVMVATELTPNTEYSFVINQLQTVLVESLEDLTGTKIVTDSKVSVISGHQAANAPNSRIFTDHLIEQLPSTKYWGIEYYIVPFLETSYTIKVLAAYNLTNVTIYCSDTVEHYVINEGEFMTKTLMFQEYCTIYSNRIVLVTQFDNGRNPMMTLVPATIHYLNQLHFSTARGLGSNDHYINIIVLEQYFQPDMILLRAGRRNMSLESQDWEPFVINNITKAYATRVAVSESTVHITHANTSALMTAIAYGFGLFEAYGHPGGLNLG